MYLTVQLYGYNISYCFCTFTATTTITTATTDTTTTGVTAADVIDDKPITMPSNTIFSDSNKVSQKRDSAEHISPDPLTKDVPSTIPSKPEPKQSTITNTQNKEADYSVSPDSTENAYDNKDIMNTCQNVSKENFPAPHVPPTLVQFTMQSEKSTTVIGNFQSNTKQLANDTVRYKILGENLLVKQFTPKIGQ